MHDLTLPQIPVHQDEQPPLPPFPGSPTSDSRDDLLDQGESKGDDSGIRRASTQIQMVCFDVSLQHVIQTAGLD